LKPKIIITVDGPGSCFQSVMDAIEEALKPLGFDSVSVKNQYPAEPVREKYVGWECELQAKHTPWGG
jgi:hypothetical protein